jgi:hypothetical protein
MLPGLSAVLLPQVEESTKGSFDAELGSGGILAFFWILRGVIVRSEDVSEKEDREETSSRLLEKV